ncbi:hypothetical protein LCGC14_1148340 [marine sediment metagenome]|uniref:Uncharacterized protein n=1 Tax=marine sediment metagenome TaxID=412755 RepID=A0A0F9Q1X8_9ZZZZ
MRIYPYNKEKKDKSRKSFYLKSLLIGVGLAILFIVLGKGIKSLIKLMIEYWAWAIAIVGVLFFIKKFFFKRKKKMEVRR